VSSEEADEPLGCVKREELLELLRGDYLLSTELVS
jgi:hypothetical protein